jgi:hypothetical protein
VIYDHIPRWVAEENPEFARAVSDYYSLEHGTVKSAARGELTWCAMAEEILSRPVPPGRELAYYGPLISRVAARAATDMAARQRGDANYFRRLAAAIEARAPAKAAAKAAGIEAADEGGGVEEMRPTEFIFEAFRFLRIRDGEGSCLPYKDDVKRHAALFMAFVNLELTEKLPLYLWENRGLTEAQTRAVLQKAKTLSGDD